MNPIHKPLATDERSAFTYTYKNRKQPEHELPDHFHDWYEIVYVYEGRGRFFLHSTFYEMSAGELFLVPANTIHRAFPDGQDPVTSTALFFSPTMLQPYDIDGDLPIFSCFEHAKERSRYKLPLSKEDRYHVEALLHEIHREQSTQAQGYRQATLLLVMQLIVSLNRWVLGNGHGAKEDNPLIPLWMKEALHFIEQHIDEPLHLSALSRRANVTASHFSRVFKQWTGMTVTAYLVSKRIVLAKEWLLTTDKNIEVISASCGFESPSYFYKAFRKLTGVTPTEYKKLHRH